MELRLGHLPSALARLPALVSLSIDGKLISVEGPDPGPGLLYGALPSSFSSTFSCQLRQGICKPVPCCSCATTDALSQALGKRNDFVVLLWASWIGTFSDFLIEILNKLNKNDSSTAQMQMLRSQRPTTGSKCQNCGHCTSVQSRAA